jgi:lyso-ornithine lipid O-acyltransferase
VDLTLEQRPLLPTDPEQENLSMARTTDPPLPMAGLRTPAAALARVPASDAAPLLRFWRSLVQQRASTASPVERAAELRRICQQACELHCIDVELEGRVPESPAVFVANHLGYIDPVVLCALVPCSPIAKSEIEAWPLVGEPFRHLNVSFVRRGSAQSGARVLKRCLRTLRAGVSVLNFPEGTTSRGGLLPFQLGAFWLARKSGFPIVPVGVEFETLDMCWVDAEAFLPHYGRLLWRRLLGKRLNVRVSVGEPIDPARFRSEMDFSWAARSALAALRRPYSRLEPRRS